MSNEAILSSKNKYTIYKYDRHIIRFRAPYSLERYTKVKEWDNGYLVVMAKYSHNQTEEEEYIDFVPILEDLYYDAHEFLVPIKKEEVKSTMKNYLKKLNVLLLVMIMLSGLVAVPNYAQAKSNKKVQLNKTSVNLTVGKSTTLKLKNASKGKKITWSSNKKKVAAVTKEGKVTAKKAGKAKIIAKVEKKKYICKVTVTKKKATTEVPKLTTEGTTTLELPPVTLTPVTPTPEKPKVVLQNTEGKNASDVALVKKMIEDNGLEEMMLYWDLNIVACYGWNEEGRLTRLICPGVVGSLDVSGCTALKELRCDSGWLSSLDVSGCTALEYLRCSGNQLSSLDVSRCTALTSLNCSGNQLSSLDVSGCTALTSLHCGENQLSSLDLTNCNSLWYLVYDEDKVAVIGYPR